MLERILLFSKKKFETLKVKKIYFSTELPKLNIFYSFKIYIFFYTIVFIYINFIVINYAYILYNNIYNNELLHKWNENI